MVRLAATCSRSRSKGRTTKTLIETACVLFRTVAVMITPYFVNAKGRLSENESYAGRWPANAMTAAVTPSATDAMKSRFNVSMVSVGRW